MDQTPVEATETRRQGWRLQIALLEQRRSEKNFLLRRDEQYLEQFRSSGKTADANLAEMIRLVDPAAQAELATRLKAIQSGFETYTKQFADVAASQIKLGLKEDLGLEGALRKSVHEIETALKPFDAPRLTVAVPVRADPCVATETCLTSNINCSRGDG